MFNRVPVTALLKGLVILLALTYILSTSYEVLTHRRMGRSNNIIGPILRGTSVGQSFVSRYENLSGVEVLIGTYGRGASSSKASLVMHLRSSPSPGPDLATVLLPPRQAIVENSWYTFKFPPIADSQDKIFYIEVESPDGRTDNALTLYWWESNPALPADPYPQGTAYRNGTPQGGDLALGLNYGPSPINALAQMGRAASANVPPAFILILLLVMAIIAYTAFRLPALLRHPDGRKRLLARWSLPLVLGVALLNGLLYLFLVPPWQGWDEQGHFTTVALLDKYEFDHRKVKSLQWWEGGQDRDEILSLKAVTWASMQRHGWTHLVAGYPLPGSAAPPLMNEPVFTDFVFELHQPPSYYWLCAATIRGLRLLGLPVDPYFNPEVALRLMRGVSVILNLGVVALAWLAGTLLVNRRDSWLRLLLPLTIALLPMHTYIAASADNDIMAELAVSSLFVAVVSLLRWPTGWRGALLAGLVVALTVACVAAKSTAIVAGVPLAGLGLAVWIGMLVTRLTDRLLRRMRVVLSPRSVVLPSALVILFLLLCSVALWLVFEPASTAAGWQIGGPTNRAARVQVADAHEGSYVMELKPGQLVYQWVDLPLPHPPFSMTFSLWVRPSGAGVNPGMAGLVVDERGRLPRIGPETLSSVERWVTIPNTVAGAWTPFAFTIPINPNDRKVRVSLAAGDHALQFDALSLVGHVPESSAGVESQVRVALFNPSAEIGSLSLRAGVRRLLPLEQVDIIDIQVNPQAFDKLAIARRFAYRQFRSFWGNFGWVSLPLSETLFTLINGVILVAFLGLAWRAMRSIGRWTRGEWLGLVSLISLIITILVGFARQVAPISTNGVYADPHGRYLFVLMIPIVWLLLAGLSIAWSQAWDWLLRITNSTLQITHPKYVNIIPWGAWMWSSAIILFSIYCFLALIGPYYYG